MHQTIVYISLACIAFLFLHQYLNRGAKYGKLPPGPRGLPLIGNLLDLPRPGQVEYLHWQKHHEKYGPISSVKVFGQRIILLHNREAVYDVMVSQAAKSAGRPSFVFAGKLCGFDFSMGSEPYDEEFRKQRKMIHKQIGLPSAVDEFYDVQQLEVTRLLIRILDDTLGIMKHVHTMSTAIVLKMTYGYFVNVNKPDPLVALEETMMGNYSKAYVPFHWLVDLVPALQYLPEGLPGTGFKRTARRWRRIAETTTQVPYNFALKHMGSGNESRICYISKTIEAIKSTSTDGQLSAEDEFSIMSTAFDMYAGGADTTSTTLKTCILLMAKFPKAQDEAHREIVSLTGSARLPQYSDREALPFTCALMKELLRFSPGVPLALTHVLEQETTYKDYVLPAGSYIVPSVWSVMHDPDVYQDPYTFDPDRFLEPRAEPDPTSDAFGFGRRHCPGQRVADVTLFLSLAQLLAVWKIRAAGVDDDDAAMSVKLEPSPGILNYIKEFELEIQPRGGKCEELVHKIQREHCWDKGDGDEIGTLLLEEDL